jgi:hypothetical protein
MGLPVYVGQLKKKAFEYLKEKIWARIQGWFEKLLSKAGKEVLIKAVAQAIPTYAMSCFYLTKGFCDEISSMIAKFWWSQQDKSNKIHWVGWETLTKPKSMGDLGFRDIHNFNIAMLSRQAWRLVQQPESLCAQILQARYYPDGDVLKAGPVEGMSYAWRSICHGIELVKEGYIWRIRDGASVNIWDDPSLPKLWDRKVSTPRNGNLLGKVADLINPISGSWDEQLVQDTFDEEEANLILSLPVNTNMRDFIAWHFDDKGCHSVKQAYKLQIQVMENQQRGGRSGSSTEAGNLNSGGDECWRRIWKAPIPPKVKMFL